MTDFSHQPVVTSVLPDYLQPDRFDNLEGWSADDHHAAFSAFAASCQLFKPAAPPAHTPFFNAVQTALQSLCASLPDPSETSAESARLFFEMNFTPLRIVGDHQAFFTAYYEPEVAGSLLKSDVFRYPLYRKPPDLIDLVPAARPSHFPLDVLGARASAWGLEPYPSRGDIDAGALEHHQLELVWLKDPVDAFFIHVQGSARIRLNPFDVMRVGYAGKNGHPYRSIGKVLIDRGAISSADMSMEALRNWLQQHPEQAAEVMAQNPSYIFFDERKGLDASKGPEAAARVQLIPERSLAIDNSLWPFGLPFFVNAHLPSHRSVFQHTLIAHDKGSAIVGAARADIFMGSGEAAAAKASGVKHRGTLYVLLPKLP